MSGALAPCPGGLVHGENIKAKESDRMSAPTLPPNLLHVERDGAQVYVTMNDGLERLCTMSRAGEAQRLQNAYLIVEACNSRPAMLAALKDVFALIDEGWLVRDTSDDGTPGFAMRQLGHVRRLAQARAAIE